MNKIEKYELATAKYKMGVITYLSNFNRYGNRACLTVNHPKKIFISRGSNHGEYGSVYDDCSVREMQKIEKELLLEGYTQIRTRLSENYSQLTAINIGETCSCCEKVVTDEDDNFTMVEDCSICREPYCSDCLTLNGESYICPNCLAV